MSRPATSRIRSSQQPSAGSKGITVLKPVLDVPFHDFSVPVFIKESIGGTKPQKDEYFYAPLLILQKSTVKSLFNRITKTAQVTFGVLMWDRQFATVVKDAIESTTGTEISPDCVLPLPIDQVRMETTEEIPMYEGDTKWSSYSMQGAIKFTLKCPDEVRANELCTIIDEDPDSFLDTILVRYNPTGQSAVKKSVTLEIEKVKESAMLSDIESEFAEEETVFLMPDDAKTLVSQIAAKALEGQSDGCEGVDQTPLVNLINKALDIQALKKEEFSDDLWEIVYWPGGTPRPDVLTNELNEIVKNSDADKKAEIVKQFKSRLPSRVKSRSKVVDGDTDQLATLIQGAKKHAEWNEQEFVPKAVDLVQISLLPLRDSSPLGTVELEANQSDSKFCGRLHLVTEADEPEEVRQAAETVRTQTQIEIPIEKPVLETTKTQGAPDLEPIVPAVRYLDNIVAESKRIDTGTPNVYQAALQLVAEDKPNMLRKYTVGTVPKHQGDSKVILVLGSTGAGKTTLINGLMNYFFGVQWSDGARLKVIVEEGEGNQAKSVTKWVSCYEAVHQFDSPSPYSLTVVDTPGFGDTEGLARDKEIVQQLKSLFTAGNPQFAGLDHIDAVCIVVQSALARLTATQRFIYDSILSIFGKNIEKNIFLLCTFADDKDPPVLAGVTEAKVPFVEWFAFNNSALYADNSDKAKIFSKLYWEMGVESMKRFCTFLAQMQPQSLSLTREVLKERAQLEAAVSDLQPRINFGLAKMEEIRQLQETVKQNERKIQDNKNFDVQVDEPYALKINLNAGEYVTNCLVCNITCHFPCSYADDKDKINCAAMTNGKCHVCPQQCAWDQHRNMQFRFDVGTKKVTRTMEEIKKAYTVAQGEKLNAVTLLKRMQKHLEDVTNDVMENIFTCNECLNRLDQIALRPNVMATAEYVEILIEAEKSEKRPNYMQRIQALEEAKQKAIFIEQARKVGASADGKNPLQKEKGWLQKMFGDKSQQSNSIFGHFTPKPKK